jgi:oligopeptide transport system ATP-binding protein
MTDHSLLEIQQITKYFRLPGGWIAGGARFVYAVDGIDLTIQEGEVFGLVGESGCGKTTLGRMILRLINPTSGKIIFDGMDLTAMQGETLRQMRRQMQVVFQNPLSSLSPRLKVKSIIAEPLRTHKAASFAEIDTIVVQLLEQVGLGKLHLDRYPHELSGGQCQRVAIARALALNPRVIVLDEPTSALDVSVQAQIINLLDELRDLHGLTYVFISHDLNVVHHISDRIGVMYLGKMVEIGSSDVLFQKPLHPYTQALLGAVPLPEVGTGDELTILEGTVPSPTDPPPGCHFHTRCPIAQNICREVEPALREVQSDRWTACHLVEGDTIAVD